MEKQFKIGDYVTGTTNMANPSFGHEYTGEIVDFNFGDPAYGRIVGLKTATGRGTAWENSLVEAKRPRAEEYVIMLKEDGKYAPASTPRTYVSEKQALHVATDMAKKHGGVFTVFKAVAEAVLPQAEPTVTKF